MVKASDINEAGLRDTTEFLDCDLCEQRVDRVARFDRCEYSTELCAECLAKAFDALKGGGE